MCFANILEICRAIINARIPEKIIATIIIIRSVSVISLSISFIATAAPVLVLPIANTVMKLKPITIVFIPPNKVKKPFFDCSINSEPITAACPAPIPGRKEHSGAEIILPRLAFKNSFLDSLIFLNGGIF